MFDLIPHPITGKLEHEESHRPTNASILKQKSCYHYQETLSSGTEITAVKKLDSTITKIRNPIIIALFLPLIVIIQVLIGNSKP